MSKPDTFRLDMAAVYLPRGAYVGGNRHILSFCARPVAAFTQGQFRPRIHSVWTPAGVGSIKPGDNMEIILDGVGVLSNPVVAEAEQTH